MEKRIRPSQQGEGDPLYLQKDKTFTTGKTERPENRGENIQPVKTKAEKPGKAKTGKPGKAKTGKPGKAKTGKPGKAKTGK